MSRRKVEAREKGEGTRAVNWIVVGKLQYVRKVRFFM